MDVFSKWCFMLVVSVLAAPSFAQDMVEPQETIEPQETVAASQALIEKTVSLFAEHGLTQTAIDQEFGQRWFDNYMAALDSQRLYFLERSHGTQQFGSRRNKGQGSNRRRSLWTVFAKRSIHTRRA